MIKYNIAVWVETEVDPLLLEDVLFAVNGVENVEISEA